MNTPLIATLSALLLVLVAWQGLQSSSPAAPLPLTDHDVTIQFGTMPVSASVADTAEERELGLSYTDSLATSTVKLFVFAVDDQWGIWMKEMAYAIDIIWLDAAGAVVHIEPSVSPDTYPTVFTPPVPARYVIEGVAGLATLAGVEVGDQIDLSDLGQE